jgi:hypothetical protein
VFVLEVGMPNVEVGGGCLSMDLEVWWEPTPVLLLARRESGLERDPDRGSGRESRSDEVTDFRSAIVFAQNDVQYSVLGLPCLKYIIVLYSYDFYTNF